MPQNAGFSGFLSYGKFELVIKKVMEKSLNFIARLLCEACYVVITDVEQLVQNL